jgi:hypothetical protein
VASENFLAAGNFFKPILFNYHYHHVEEACGSGQEKASLAVRVLKDRDSFAPHDRIPTPKADHAEDVIDMHVTVK